MKKILFGIILLALLSLGAWAVLRNGEELQIGGEEEALLTYQDPDGIFAFEYPRAFSVTGREAAGASSTGWSSVSQEPGLVLARLTVPKTYMPNTNFSEAWFIVGWSNDPQAIRNCGINATLEGMDVQDATLDGYPFRRFSIFEAAAGNQYDTTAYRGILDGDCYSLEYTIHSTNILNYPAELGLTEFDRAELKALLDGVVRSFGFQVNSD